MRYGIDKWDKFHHVWYQNGGNNLRNLFNVLKTNLDLIRSKVRAKVGQRSYLTKAIKITQICDNYDSLSTSVTTAFEAMKRNE